MHGTKLKHQQETERARVFHTRIRVVIVGGFVLLIVAASVLTMVVG